MTISLVDIYLFQVNKNVNSNNTSVFIAKFCYLYY